MAQKIIRPDTKPVIYLAGAIDEAPLEFITGWRQIAKKYLSQIGYRVIDPVELVDIDNPPPVNEIVEQDLELVSKADYLLVEMDIPNRNYIGTCMEIRQAYIMQRPVIVWTGYYTNRTFLKYHATEIFATLFGALHYFRNLREGI